jgi:hypothetical protein
MPEIFKMCLGLSSGLVKDRVISSLSEEVLRHSFFGVGESSITNNKHLRTKNPLRKSARGQHL